MRSESKRRTSIRIATAIACWAALLVPVHAGAAVFQVDTTADTTDASAGDGACADASGACSLRAAIEEANALVGADEVSIPAGVYVAFLSVYSGGLTLRGAGAQATVIDGTVYHDGGAQLVIERLAIVGGAAAGIAQFGGSSLVLSETIVSNNGRGPCSFVCGGVISFFGTVAVTGSAITENGGGGVAVIGGGALTVTTSTISGNLGPAISAESGRIRNSTISGNVSSNRLWCEGGGVPGCECEPASQTVQGSFEVEYSTIANNSVDASTCAVPPLPVLGSSGPLRGTVLSNPGLANCAPPLVSLGRNLDSDGSCGFSDPTDLSNVDPLLGPLQDNGGPTPTHALLRGSPAIDAIPVSDCTWDDDGDPGTPEVPLATDQRGVTRPREGNGAAPSDCDIGAYEATKCADGIDNDGDGRIDFDGGATAGLPPEERTAPDPHCASALSPREASACGLGAEVAALLMVAMRLGRRGHRSRRQSA